MRPPQRVSWSSARWRVVRHMLVVAQRHVPHLECILPAPRDMPRRGVTLYTGPGRNLSANAQEAEENLAKIAPGRAKLEVKHGMANLLRKRIHCKAKLGWKLRPRPALWCRRRRSTAARASRTRQVHNALKNCCSAIRGAKLQGEFESDESGMVHNDGGETFEEWLVASQPAEEGESDVKQAEHGSDDGWNTCLSHASKPLPGRHV